MEYNQNRTLALCFILCQLLISAYCTTTESNDVTNDVFQNDTTVATSENEKDNDVEFPIWAWSLIAVAGFVVVVLLISILIYVTMPSKPRPPPGYGPPRKAAPRPVLLRRPVVPVAPPAPAPMIMPIAQPQPQKPKAVLTPSGPVPLITSIPVLRRYGSQPNLRAFRNPGYDIRPARTAVPMIEYPEEGITIERDAYSDIEQSMPFDEEAASIYGSVGRRSLYGGSMRSNGRRSTRRSRRSRIVPTIADIYGGNDIPAGPYTVIEERIPVSHAARAYSGFDY